MRSSNTRYGLRVVLILSTRFNACKVFLWLPLYWLAYNQMVNNLTSQSAVLQLHGVPNDLLNNLNPITLVIFIPVMDFFIYPALRKARIHFTPIKRITWGFFIASAAMISSAVLQSYIYKLSACPDRHVNDGVWPINGEDTSCVAPINVWVQAVPYCLIAFSEIFASITGLEYAFSKAPENMRGVVMGVNLLQTAFSSAIGQALVPLAEDPLLTWNYTVVAILAALGGKQSRTYPTLHDRCGRGDHIVRYLLTWTQVLDSGSHGGVSTPGRMSSI